MDAQYGERPFRDRADAGRRLAERLSAYRYGNPIVLALPRGGVPVGYEIARALDAPLDVFVARKLGAPGQPELGIGAVAQGGTRILNQRLVEHLGISDDYLERITRREEKEVKRRLNLLCGGRPELEVRGRAVILVDDGLATGVTARAAIESLRERHPRQLILAIPVCAAQTARWIQPEVDAFVSLEIPSDLYAIGFWYENFEQVSDREVMKLLDRAWRGRKDS